MQYQKLIAAGLKSSISSPKGRIKRRKNARFWLSVALVVTLAAGIVFLVMR